MAWTTTVPLQKTQPAMRFDFPGILKQSGVPFLTAMAIRNPNPERLPLALCAAVLHAGGLFSLVRWVYFDHQFNHKRGCILPLEGVDWTPGSLETASSVTVYLAYRDVKIIFNTVEAFLTLTKKKKPGPADQGLSHVPLGRWINGWPLHQQEMQFISNCSTSEVWHCFSSPSRGQRGSERRDAALHATAFLIRNAQNS